MNNPENPNSSKDLMASQPQELSVCKPSQARLDELLAGCFTLQKMYGRAPDSMETVTMLFHSLLGKYPAKKVINAFEMWLERSQEFPTPADIIGLIKRRGKPPIKESDIITIRKKEVCDWTRAEGRLVEEWEAQQREEWQDDSDPHKAEDTQKEMARLRQQVREQRSEIQRLNALLAETRIAKGMEPPPDRVSNTLRFMQASGCTQCDIDEFCATMGVPAPMQHEVAA